MIKILLYILLPLFASAAAPPEIETGTEINAMLEANIHPRSWNENVVFMKDFAQGNDAFCKTWSPKAFEVQPDLYNSCQFAPLLKRYLKKLNALKNESASGIVMPEIPLKDASLPILQSGAWQGLVMSDVEGTESALEIISLRVALEKSLRSHSKLIRTQSHGVFNSFAALTVPRMIAAFSAYSLTLQRLVFIDAFECGAQRTKACMDVQSKLTSLKGEVYLGIDSEDFLNGLENLTEENASRAQLKTKKVQKVALLLAKLKTEVSLKDLLKSLNGTRVHPVYQEIKAELNLLTSNGLGASNDDQAGMLVAVSILSEISELQARKHQIPVTSSAFLPKRSQQTQEEMSKLQSLVLKMLSTDEVAP